MYLERQQRIVAVLMYSDLRSAYVRRYMFDKAAAEEEESGNGGNNSDGIKKDLDKFVFIDVYVEAFPITIGSTFALTISPAAASATAAAEDVGGSDEYEMEGIVLEAPMAPHSAASKGAAAATAVVISCGGLLVQVPTSYFRSHNSRSHNTHSHSSQHLLQRGDRVVVSLTRCSSC